MGGASRLEIFPRDAVAESPHGVLEKGGMSYAGAGGFPTTWPPSGLTFWTRRPKPDCFDGNGLSPPRNGELPSYRLVPQNCDGA